MVLLSASLVGCKTMGHGGGLVVSVRTLNSDNPNLNLAKVYNYFGKKMV